MAELQGNALVCEDEFLAFLNEIDFDGMNEEDSNEDDSNEDDVNEIGMDLEQPPDNVPLNRSTDGMNEDDSNEDDSNEDDSNEDDVNEDGMNEDDVNEIGMDLEQPPDNVPLNRSTDSDTLAVQRSESLLSFSPACHRLFRKYKLSSNLNEEQGRLDAFITNFNLKHSLVQEFSRIVNDPSARVNLQQHLSQYIESEQYDQIYRDWAHTMMHFRFKKSVDKCRRTLQESNPGVTNKIQIDLCHVYALLYLSRVKDAPPRLNVEMPSTVSIRATLRGLLHGNPKVVQILLFLSAGSAGAAPVNLGRNGPGRAVNEIIYFTEPESVIHDASRIPRRPRGVHVPVPLCSHMNVWENPQPCRMATNWLLSRDSSIYRNIFELIQEQLNSKREQFEAIVIMLDSILEAAHEFLNGQSLFEIAPYLDTYGVSCPKSHPNSVLLREINYQRLPEPLDET